MSGSAACSSPRAHDLSSEPDGTYTFAVRASDAAGNTGAAASSDYALDRTGASVQIDSGPGATDNNRAPEWAFSAEAGAGFECRLERGASVVSNWAACASPQAFDLSSQPDGTYTFLVRATDSSGNQGAPSRADYELDTAPPPAPSIDAEPGIAEQGHHPRVGLLRRVWRDTRMPPRGRRPAGGRLGPVLEPALFNVAGEDGLYTLSVRATDAAGNMGAFASSSVELDTTAPNPPEITASPGRFGEDVTPVWRFTGEQGATFECSLRRGPAMIAGADGCESPREYDLGHEPDGDYTISLRARDAAGNLSVARTDDYELRVPARPANRAETAAAAATTSGTAPPQPRPPDDEQAEPIGVTSVDGPEPRYPAGGEPGQQAAGGNGGSVGEGIAGTRHARARRSGRSPAARPAPRCSRRCARRPRRWPATPTSPCSPAF